MKCYCPTDAIKPKSCFAKRYGIDETRVQGGCECRCHADNRKKERKVERESERVPGQGRRRIAQLFL